MKTLKKALILLLALTLVFSFVACGGTTPSNGSEDDGDNGGAGGDAVKGETRTWGNFTVLVPEGMTLKGGNLLNAEDPDCFNLHLTDNELHYVMIDLALDEESAKDGVATTKEMNEDSDPKDVTLTAGAAWTGVSYNYYGSCDCFQIYATVNGRVVVARGAYYAFDSATVKAILSSLTYTPAES